MAWKSGPRSVKRAWGSASRCQMMTRMERPMATSAFLAPRRRAIRRYRSPRVIRGEVPAPPGGTGPVAGYIARWRPLPVSPEAAAFARDVIAAVAPGGQERAKNLLWAAGRLADYAASLAWT